MRVAWLPGVLRSAGLEVIELPGCYGRGKEILSIEGVVWHHTATGPNWTDATVAALLRDGRLTPGPTYLPGPLCQLGLQRDGRFVLVADGKANHNGFGEWGNQSLGIEAYNNGLGEPWPAVQIDAYERGTAAILGHLGKGADRMKGHRETDPGRKIDPAGINLDAARRHINVHLTPQPKGPLMALSDKEQEELLTKVRELHDDYAVSVAPGGKQPRTGKVRPDGSKRYQIGRTYNKVLGK